MRKWSCIFGVHDHNFMKLYLTLTLDQSYRPINKNFSPYYLGHYALGYIFKSICSEKEKFDFYFNKVWHENTYLLLWWQYQHTTSLSPCHTVTYLPECKSRLATIQKLLKYVANRVVQPRVDFCVRTLYAIALRQYVLTTYLNECTTSVVRY